jgi:hypothetical protein
MLSYCANYAASMPDITVYMNCDTRLAINIGVFELGEYDEFIFAVKNYDYINSPYVYLFRARRDDADERGEIIFKIDPDASKAIKPGAFYNFALLVNAYNELVPTEYKKLTDNGRVNIEYGAQDLALPDQPPLPPSFREILGAKLEHIDKPSANKKPCIDAAGAILDIQLEDTSKKH